VRFSPEQLLRFAREAFKAGNFGDCLGFLHRMPHSPEKDELEAQASYAYGKLLLAEGKLGDARESFSMGTSFRRFAVIQFLSQERCRLLSILLNNPNQSVLAIHGLASRARVKHTYELASDQFSPVVDYVGCLAAYRSKYDEERNDELSKLIRLLKRGGKKDVVIELGKLLADFLFSETPILKKADFIIPVPQEPERVSRRGYSIPYLLAAEVSIRCAIPVLDDIVTSTGTLPELRYIPRWARKAALEGAFEVSASNWVRERSILIIDDVITSGATVISVGETLREAGASEVLAIALAHTERSVW
jgi:predicted amidophosphoribosyltransferase